MQFLTGDWVQAGVGETITVEDTGDPEVVVAEAGAVGHALGDSADGWVNVFWERTGATTLVDVAQIVFLHRPKSENSPGAARLRRV